MIFFHSELSDASSDALSLLLFVCLFFMLSLLGLSLGLCACLRTQLFLMTIVFFDQGIRDREKG